ncbi:MAG: trypsin-like peptidase domain-containing protein [Ignavibacteria bacterium]|nr:trypsin-like peptidase domain-containing protein [Ignavibacteria bacterium]
MFKIDLKDKIKEVKNSIIAIGFNPNPQQITIIGSGFAISDDGKILTAAHLYNQLNEEQRKNLKANVMVEEMGDNLERYKWIPIKLINKNDKDDLATFQLEEYKDTFLRKLDLADSDKMEIGQEVYFIGFPYAAQLMNDGFGVTLVVNKGIISNIKRDGVDPSHKRNWLIVDAISNPGNSGCPLIDIETNKVIGVMTIAFRTKSQAMKELDIREPMHIAGARPINLVKDLLK